MGQHNVIAGRTAAADGDLIGFDVQNGGRLRAPAEGPVQPGEPIAIAVRSDKVRVGAGEEGFGFTGLVSAVEYRGAFVQIAVSAPGIDEFAVSVDEADYFRTPLAVGDAVPMSWSREHVHVLA